MGQRVSHNMCCSVRDKNEKGRNLALVGAPQFRCSEVEVRIETPSFLAFAPLWSHSNGAAPPKRLALAGDQEVHVYRISDELMTSDTPNITLEHTLTLPSGQCVTGILFTEESSSRNLAVAFGPRTSTEDRSHVGSGPYVVRIWSCEPLNPWSGRPAESPAPSIWKWNEGYSESLEDHRAPCLRLVASPAYLLTADNLGECRVWQKNKAFAKRAVAKLHQGGIADLAVDRLFVYSAGNEDRRISVWSVPDLTPVLNITADFPEEMVIGFPSEGSPAVSPMQMPTLQTAPYRLARLTALKRPLSRWAGSQGSNRNQKTPKGSIYLAGVMAGGNDNVEGAEQGVLMEWALGHQPFCQSLQIAHESPIASMAYGPYDNGPLVTADAFGVFRVWDCVPRLTCSQQLEILNLGELRGNRFGSGVAMVVEPQRGLYSTVGDKRLFVWRRHQLSELLQDPF
eukprot:gnl/TRDRNA2_/TRDRNA2_83218_c0_seq1.p1 gnl/TRDRNA2_/TRDRNA2_83218_c0~~gnl/TRDRNA2_/TRDRNA2_83218_c0_seq1.p1  ORF type:complete len:454 (-),score=65.28 gnl/TRDRNA2_/TRDRNA2_83218_c0_seq1:112-1473(-)